MKKLLFTIFIFFSFVVCINASTSSSFHTGNWISNVYINKVKDGIIHYKQAIFIKDDKGEIAYCVEPFENLNTNGSYNGYDSDYAKHLGISNDVWKKISLIAYYGYGYGSHTSDKWYAVTQVMIWREIDKNASFYFTDKLNGSKVTTFDSEIKEIESLVNSHNVLPSFASKTYNYSINSSNTLSDSNNVLNTFSITSNSSNLNVSKNGNNLIIKTGNVVNEKISFEKKFNNYNKSVFVFVDNSYQNVMTPGNVESLKFNISVNILEGKLKITKVDYNTGEKTPSGEGILIGSTYGLYNSNNDLVKTLIIDDSNEAYIDNLEFGKYYIKELSSMEGYLLDDQIYSFEINEKNLEINLLLKNKAIKSTVVINKYFDEKLESGISFEITNSKDEVIKTVTTDENGQISVDLYYGKYTFHQLNSSKNYLTVDDFEVVIDNNSESVITINKYDERFFSKLVIVKKDSKTGNIIKNETVFKLFDLDNKEYYKVNDSEELKTVDGILTIEKLTAGNYELEEYKAPIGYKKSDEKIRISVDDESQYDKDENNNPIIVLEYNNEEETIEVNVPNTSLDYKDNPFIFDDKKKKLTIFS